MAGSDNQFQRFMLWIDAVGGYLVCLGDEVVIGQGTAVSAAEIAIQADLSRKHAKIARISGGYLIEPLHGRVIINGRPAVEAALLADGDDILLGDSVKLRFRKPHVLSSSARLEIISGHRSRASADAIILMAESCVLGPSWQNHVVCREWNNDVVLYRNAGQLYCRAAEPITIDCKLCGRSGRVQQNSRVVGGYFSFTVEAV